MLIAMLRFYNGLNSLINLSKEGFNMPKKDTDENLKYIDVEEFLKNSTILYK